MHISYSLQHTTIVQKNMCYTVSFIMSKQLNKLKGNERDVTEWATTWEWICRWKQLSTSWYYSCIQIMV